MKKLRRRLAGILAILTVLVVGLALLPGTTRAATPLQLAVGQGSIDNTVYYVDWLSVQPSLGTASGVIVLPGGHTVNVNFAAVFANGSAGSFAFGQTSCGTNYWNPTAPYVSAQVPNPPPPCELLALVGGANQIYRITLSEPIRDPLMAIVSLGNPGLYTQYDFDSPFTIVSQGTGYWGGTSTSLQQLPGDILQGNEGHGTIRFLGTFNTFSWVVPTGENWHGFTFGIRTTAALAAPVTVNEGQPANNSGFWSGDNVTLGASAGTIIQHPNGAWSWAMPTNDGPAQSQNITITATDAFGSISRTFGLVVKNVAPTAGLNNNGPVSTGAPLTASFSGQVDPSSADGAAGFRYAFDCNGGPLGGATYATSSPSPSVQCTYPTAGPVTVRGRIIDKDGGATEYTTSANILAPLCQPGTFSPDGNAPCTPAAPGSYVPGPGATAAIPCSPGFFQNQAGQTSCLAAPPGTFVSTTGAISAVPCAPGTFQPAMGSVSCLPAPVDYYVPTSGAVAAIACPAGTGTGGLTGATSCTAVVVAPPFSLPGSLPAVGTCLCLPPYMVQDQFSTQHWWARAAGGGPLVISPFAIGVNPSETGTLTVGVYDPSNTLVGTVSGAHPGSGDAPLPSVTVGVPVPGGLYHITVQVSGGAPQARHYRLEAHGATLLGANTPTQAQPEHDPARWILNVAAGESINAQVSPGPEAGASSAVVRLYSPAGTLVETGGLGSILGSTPAAAGGQWILEVIPTGGHYLVTKGGGIDRGIYVNWQTWGYGSINVSLIRNGLPNAVPVAVEVVDLLTNVTVAMQPGVTGSANFLDLPAGNYRVRVTGPDNVSVDTFVTCDGVTPVTITLPNRPPKAIADTATTSEDTAAIIPVLSNDSDSDGGTLSVTSVTQGAHGSVVVNGGGTVTYTPAANWNGTDTFTYTISDGQGGTATATVTVTVTPVNDQPDAVDDTATTPEDTAVIVNVTGNDTDVDGDTLSVTGVTQGTNGTVAISGNQVTYTPAANWYGTDTFTYTIVDGNGGTDTATVTVTVNSVNDLPLAANDSASTNAGFPVTVSVLTNDSDSDGGTLSVASTTAPANGTVVINASGTVTYTPNFGFSGTDTFTYTVSDGQGGTATATVTVTVIPMANASRMTGGGSIESGKGKTATRSTWGFEIRCDGSQGNLEFQDHGGGNFHMEVITSVFCVDDPAVGPGVPKAGFDTLRLTGVGRWNGTSGHTVEATIVDAGEPGTRDTITITVKTAGGAVVSTLSGTLTGGNHQAHK